MVRDVRAVWASRPRWIAGKHDLLALVCVAGACSLTGASMLSPAVPTAAALTEAEDNCASAANPIVCENALPGDPESKWQLEKVGDPTIQGFAT
jgi:hypothetical protein